MAGTVCATATCMDLPMNTFPPKTVETIGTGTQSAPFTSAPVAPTGTSGTKKTKTIGARVPTTVTQRAPATTTTDLAAAQGAADGTGSDTNIAPAIGGVVGGLLVVCGLVGVGVWMHKRRTAALLPHQRTHTRTGTESQLAPPSIGVPKYSSISLPDPGKLPPKLGRSQSQSTFNPYAALKGS